ncbi:MAG: shikimate kinase [Betaproteobacteria bacterium]|nr:shikimate kinase [Betaproteobacteria bacterium]
MTRPFPDPSCHPIAFIGMMGSGKSTVGKRLARALGRPFLDADSELERRCGVPIQTIFELEGEEGFRQRESELLLGLTGSADLILAMQDLWVRLRHDRSRPLLKTADPKSRIAELLRFREPLYQSVAHWSIPTGRQAPERVVQDILRLLEIN